MKNEVDWLYLYHKTLNENQGLKKQIRVLEEILRTHLPVVEANIIKKKKVVVQNIRQNYRTDIVSIIADTEI